MAETVQLFVVTVLLRPFVCVFLVFHLTAATAAIGWRRTALFTGIACIVAFSAEYSSTRNGIPWFLGTTYEYPEPGLYFDVPLTNFPGWAIVGFVIGEVLLGIVGIMLYIPITWMVCTRCRQWSAMRGLISREVLS